eukprot:528103-Prorocentrum_minimum.AAC.1
MRRGYPVQLLGDQCGRRRRCPPHSMPGAPLLPRGPALPEAATWQLLAGPRGHRLIDAAAAPAPPRRGLAPPLRVPLRRLKRRSRTRWRQPRNASERFICLWCCATSNTSDYTFLAVKAAVW